MTWQDPLKFGRDGANTGQRNFRNNGDFPYFDDEVSPTMQYAILADCFSNMALAIIGDEVKMDFTVSNVINTALADQVVEELEVFDNLKEMGREFDTLFLTLLKNNFSEAPKKYNALVEHFHVFKEAHLQPIFKTIIEDQELYLLTLGAIGAKLTEGLSSDEIKKRQAYIDMILDYLDQALEREVDYVEDYAEDINTAFWESVMKENPGIFSLQDFKKSFGEFSSLLSHILTEHLRWLKLNCLYLLHEQVL